LLAGQPAKLRLALLAGQPAKLRLALLAGQPAKLRLALLAGQPAKLRLALLAGSLLVFNKILAGTAFVFLNYAISLGSVVLVNAMQGMQYVFLLCLTVFFAKTRPHILEEEINWPLFGQKFLAVILIGIGLLILAQ
jgi:hypothetical protein